jgi:NADH-quinone oxidoreductase subunit K
MNEVAQSLKMMPINYYIAFCAVLFTIGVIGVLIKRNAIVIFLSVELMLNAINLLLVAFSVYHNNPGGQVMVIFVMVIAAAEVAAGLAILVANYRNTHSIDMNLMNQLKG